MAKTKAKKTKSKPAKAKAPVIAPIVNVSTGAAMAELSAAKLPVLGLAVVSEVTAMPGHSFVQVGEGQSVRIHWAKEVSPNVVAQAASIIGQHCDPVCESPTVLVP
jgi:hypothetical protein